MKDPHQNHDAVSSSRTEHETSRLERGHRLKIVREEVAKKNVPDFAALMGVGRSSVSRYESGERSPDAEYLVAVSQRYGVGLDWLITGAGPMKPGDLPPPRPMTVDSTVLCAAIELVERVVRDTNRQMTPEHRADLIRGAYEALMAASDEEKRRELSHTLDAMLRRAISE